MGIIKNLKKGKRKIANTYIKIRFNFKRRMTLKKICDLLGYTEEEYMDKIGDYYTSLTIDKRFVLLENHEWDLREKHAVELVIDDDEEDESLEDDSEEEVEENDEEEISSEDELDTDDDLDDLTVISEDDEEDEDNM